MPQVADDQVRIGETYDEVGDAKDGPFDRPAKIPAKPVEGGEEKWRLNDLGQDDLLTISKDYAWAAGRMIIVSRNAVGCITYDAFDRFDLCGNSA